MPQDFKLELHNYAMDGTVINIEEGEIGAGTLVHEKTLKFTFFDKVQKCVASVTFATSDFEDDLYINAVKFVRRLKLR